MKIDTLIITGFGLNCEKETAKAFELAGARVEQIHLNDLISNKEKLSQYQILAFIGGFSFGDHLGSGTIFAYRVLSQLKKQLERFINEGKLVIGICNGFQIMTRLGIVPGLKNDFIQEVTLHHNDSGVFSDSWVTLKVNKKSPCVFTKNLTNFSVPIRHGEGKFIPKNEDVLKEIEDNHLVCLRYANNRSHQTSNFPYNPNGSINDIAGICNHSGRVFGLMPHPEAYLSPYNHPQWLEQKNNNTLPNEGLGLAIFKNAVNFVKNNF